MAPPRIPTTPIDASTAAASPPTLETLLSISNLFRDESNAENPLHLAQRWESEQSFRTGEHPGLVIALADLRRFLNSGELSEGARGRLETWAHGPAAGEAGSLDHLVLQNLTAVLSRRDASLPQERFQQLADLLGVVRVEEEAPAAMPRLTGEGSSDIEIQSTTLSFHFADEALRDWPSYNTFGALPREGLSQSLSSTFGGSAGVEWAWNGYRFLTDLYGADGVPQGAPAEHVAQFGVRFGIHSYGGFGFGDFSGFRARFLGGLSRSGFGLGAAWCTSVDGSEVSGVGCEGSAAFQLSAFSESDFITIGYGPIEIGWRTLFNNSTSYINVGGGYLPDLDRDPMSFRLTYYFRDPSPPPRDPEAAIFPTAVTDAQIFADGASILNRFIQNNFRRRQEGAYELTRMVLPSDPFGASGSAAQFSLVNLGSFFNGIFNGFDEGSMAYSLSRDFRLGNDAQRAVLAAMLGAEFLTNAIGAIASPDRPEDLQARAFDLAWPANLAQDTLAVLGAVGAFGNRDAVIREEGGPIAHFAATHGALALGGAILILTSGDGSGDGFLNLSILGNQLPNATGVMAENSRFSFDSQGSQFLRLEIGTMMLAYAINAVLDVGTNIFSYRALRASRAEAAAEATEREASASLSEIPISASIETDGHSRFMATLGGTF